MPSLDAARGRARLSLEHVSVLGSLFARESVPEESATAYAELVNSGLVSRDGVPVPALGPLMRVLAGAWLTMDIETVGAGGTVGHGAWVAAADGVTAEGWPGDRECEYAPLEPSMLPWTVARILGLRRREIPEPDMAVPVIRTKLGVVDGAISGLAEVPVAGIGAAREAVRQVLDQEEDLSPLECRMLTDVLVGHRVSWRVTSSWTEPRGEQEMRSLAVLDSGLAGYWRRDDPTPEEFVASGRDASVVLVRRRAADVWRELVGLLPQARKGSEPVGAG